MTTRLIGLILSVVLLQACVSTGAGGTSDEDAAIANMNLGAGYLNQGRADLAIDRLQRALDQNPRLADAHSTIAIAYDTQGHAELAEEHYLLATQLAPENGAAANSYGVFLCRHDRWADAQPYFQQAADAVNYSGEVALTNAGVCALDSGAPQDAERFLREALQRNPRYAAALAAMANMAVRSREFLPARGFVQRYTEVAEPTAAILLTCFTVETELDDAVAAERCAAELRERFPNSAEARNLRDYITRNGQ